MINNNLKFCRESLEMTQKELGFVFGVSEFTVSGWENCNDNMPLTKLIRFCNMYNFSADYVIGLTRKNNNPTTMIKINKKKIGDNLRKIRKQLNLTQQQIADECAISRTTFSNYELGINLITTMTLYIICKKHNLSVYDILC